MTTQQNDPKVMKELMRREPIFHRPEFGTTRLDFENMTEETFWEVGASRFSLGKGVLLDDI